MIKKIRVEDLQVGMFVEDFNTPWMDHPFLTSKKKIRSVKEIDLLLKHRLVEVFIDTKRGKDSPKASPLWEAGSHLREELEKEPIGSTPEGVRTCDALAPDTTPYDEELRQAAKVYGEAKSVVKGLLTDVRMGRSIDGEAVATTVDAMVDSIFRNRDALTSLSRLKSFDDYTFHHSLNVGVLTLALARHLGILKEELRRLGIGAILHDVGKMKVPQEILQKPGRLTDEEFAVVKSHSLHGAKLLLETEGLAKECAAVPLNHHERFNGTGYPRGLKGMAIGKFGLISAIADVYDAITSDRVYHRGIPAHLAIQKIYEWAKTDFHTIYVQKFIQCVGIYPVGSVVRLDTGEVGVVVRQNPDRLLHPLVRVVLAASGEKLVGLQVVDLSESDPSGVRPYARSVADTLTPDEVGIDVEKLLSLSEGRNAA